MNKAAKQGEDSFFTSLKHVVTRYRSRVLVMEGRHLTIPPRIQRTETLYSKGWQVRYRGTTKYFGDNGYESAYEALEAAKTYLGTLYEKYANVLPYSRLRTFISPSKQNDLPVGISGPCWRYRKNSDKYCEFKVLVPRPGKRGKMISIYIGTPLTWVGRYERALDKAIAARKAGVLEWKKAVRAKKIRADKKTRLK